MKELTIEELKQCAANASKNAIKRALDAGIPVTYQEGCDIVKHYPDGTNLVIGAVPPDVVIPKRKYKIL